MYITKNINISLMKDVLKQHPKLKNEILKFIPKVLDTKNLLKSYNRFLKHKDNLNLLDFGFIPKVVNSPTFGEKTFYKSKIDFFWVELYEFCILKHSGLL